MNMLLTVMLLAGNNANGVFCVKRHKGRFNAYQRTYVITSRDKNYLDVVFLYYFLNTLSSHLTAYSTGTATKFLTRTILDSIPVPLPPLKHQNAISSLLSALDDKIDLNRQINETLEALARLFFKDWFVDFGPTRAKAEGRTSYLAPELWSLFPDAIDDDDKPMGWRIGELQEIVEMNPSEPLPREQIAPYLGMAFLSTSGPISEPPVKRNFSSGMRFRNGDTLFARITPCLENGKAAFVQNLPPNTRGWGSTAARQESRSPQKR